MRAAGGALPTLVRTARWRSSNSIKTARSSYSCSRPLCGSATTRSPTRCPPITRSICTRTLQGPYPRRSAVRISPACPFPPTPATRAGAGEHLQHAGPPGFSRADPKHLGPPLSSCGRLLRAPHDSPCPQARTVETVRGGGMILLLVPTCAMRRTARLACPRTACCADSPFVQPEAAVYHDNGRPLTVQVLIHPPPELVLCLWQRLPEASVCCFPLNGRLCAGPATFSTLCPDSMNASCCR